MNTYNKGAVGNITGAEILGNVERMMKSVPKPTDYVYLVHEDDATNLESISSEDIGGAKSRVIVHRDQYKEEPKFQYWWWRLLCRYLKWKWLFTYRKVESMVVPGTVIRIGAAMFNPREYTGGGIGGKDSLVRTH